jgi:hypothetical protein
MDTAVSPKMRRRQGVRRENIPGGSSTDEQRNRRLIFAETLRAEALLNLGFVTSRLQIFSDMLPRKLEQQINLAAPRACSAPKSKIALSGGDHNFSTGC